MTTALPLMRNSLTPLAKSVLVPLELLAATIQQKHFGLDTTALIISNEQMDDIMKIFKSLEESGLVKKGVSETTKNKPK